MKDFRMQITLDEETDTYIKDYMEEHNIRYNGEAIVRICREHQASKNTEWSLNYISEIVSKNLHDVLKSELTKIRLGANSADRNTQILIELLNGYFFLEGVDSLITTDKQEMGSVKIAKEVVAERISNARQKRLDHEASKNNVT
ncbi:hypothetical protein P4493_16850 [Bacillus thuringiensis]|jgi:hypothetical protein|uniref:Uncharacterized protein n=3 Tax=Bacillus cereus group TaxID=86661 RepID=A0A9X5RNT6_BACTU|nr:MULTISPECIES: hypothetical protein [Bacillus]EAO54368.1 hypothetical protein RBTH_05431 [Bacillus thuringiensis serovar israelensis ATCC 35646]KAB0449417.1 hypothetical protein CH334_04950 [Lysinibacillus sp. VIA-II-2016]MED1157516.1 hypothetical protein [Bacillus paranthracis]AJH03286.1 hypothetical protein AS86_5763 [Bacillus thuringiensis HD1002]AKR13017.1 hypothetical protein AC241_30465 [Bacillus thuringiensis]